jgi:hypothetical protein
MYYRLVYIANICRERVWWHLFPIVWAVWGAFTLVRDEIWRPKNESSWRIINMIPHLSLELWIVGLLVCFLAWLFESSYRIRCKLNCRIAELTGTSSLQIFFDPTNPLNHFWSQELVSNEDKTKIMHFMEYRVRITNNSAKTIRNVRVIRRHDGITPILPQTGIFKIDGSIVRDLQPKCSELVPVCHVGKPHAGDAWGETATQLHSPIIIIASGDDINPTVYKFSYHPDSIPALIAIIEP